MDKTDHSAKETFYDNFDYIKDFVIDGYNIPKERDPVKALALLLYNYKNTEIVKKFRNIDKDFAILSSYNKGTWTKRYACLQKARCFKLARAAAALILRKNKAKQ